MRHVLSKMQARMKELETAVIHATNYHSAVCPYRDISSADKDPSADKLAESVCALSIQDTGNAQYYGPSAGTEVRDRPSCRIPFSCSSGTAVGQSEYVGLFQCGSSNARLDRSHRRSRYRRRSSHVYGHNRLVFGRFPRHNCLGPTQCSRQTPFPSSSEITRMGPG